MAARHGPKTDATLLCGRLPQHTGRNRFEVIMKVNYIAGISYTLCSRIRSRK